jgi:hypothetical protein
MFSSGSTFSRNAEVFFKGFPGEMAYLPGLGGLIGIVSLWKINKNLFIYLSLLILICLIISLNYSTAEIQSFYYLIYYLIDFFISVGIFLISLKFGEKTFLFTGKINSAIIFSCIIIFIFSIGLNFRDNNSSHDFVNEDITKNSLNVLEGNSILLTYDYSFVFSSSLYFQQVEKIRPDVKVFDIKFLSATWYLEMIKKYYPDVYQNFSSDAEEYIRTYNFEDIEHPARLTKMVKAFFDKNISKFPIYLTVDCLLSKDMSTFLAAYYPEPDGLVYRLREKNSPYNPEAGKLSLNAVFRKYEPVGYHKNKMYVSTPGVFYETAFYHYKNKNYGTSMKFIEKALELNSSFKDALNLKNQIINETRKN